MKKRKIIYHFVIWLSALFCIGFWAAQNKLAFAAELSLPAKKLEYFAERKDLKAFLREFASSQGIQISIDPEIQGTLSGRYELTPRAMLALLCANYGLEWYFDGRVLHVEPASSAQSEVIQLKDISPETFLASLNQLGVSDKRFSLSIDQNSKSVLASGPRKFVELVKQTAQAADKPAGSFQNTVTRIFPLRYALAEDRVMRHGGQEYKVQGIASILQRLYGQNNSDTAGTAKPVIKQRKPIDNRLARVKGTELSVRLPPRLPQPDELVAGEPERSALQPGAGAGLPAILADAQSNSIIIRDFPAMLATHEEVIRTLDKRPVVVEIEATIIEVNSDQIAALGIDWRLNGNRVDAASGSGTALNPILDPRGTGALSQSFSRPLTPTLANVQGLVLSTVLGDKTTFFARLAALEGEGKAWVKAAPKVMTLNNVEAVLESISTFFIKVGGFQDAQLFDVSVGVSMRIVPTLVGNSDSSELRLQINIDDGAITDQFVDQLPVIQKSTISTQALVKNGLSLLIAGYTREVSKERHSGIPVLSRLPFIGAAFGTKDTSKMKLERMFLLTPKLVEL
jgi:type III secretion protein C